MTPLQRFQAALQRDQDRLNARLNEDAELIREYRDEDEGKGIVWAIASHRSAAFQAEPCFTVSALRAAAAIARGDK